MEKTNLFSIGNMAKLFHLSVSSLRHYEEAGLLRPEYIDPNSGYRYYSTRQFELLNTIRYLRTLDLPLSEISDFLQNREVERIEQKLRQQKEIVIQKQQELKRIEKKIDNRLKQIEDARHSVFDSVELVSKKSCRIVWAENTLNVHDSLDMEAPIRQLEQTQAETVVFLGKVGLGISREHLRQQVFDGYDGIFLILDEEDQFDGATVTLPETICVSCRFHGSHAQAPIQYQKLLNYIKEHKLEIDGFSREVTMIDYGLTNNTEKFVTEINIPVTI